MRFRFRRIDVMLKIAVVVFVVIAFQFVFTVSGSDDDNEQPKERKEAEEGSSSPPLTLRPEVKPRSDRGSRSHVGLTSKACQSRGKCGDGTEVTSGPRNCFCDRLCSYYDDCCHDYRSEDDGGGDQYTTHLPRGVATCQRVNDIETGSSVEVFRVSRCPKGFVDFGVRRLCETEVGPAMSDRFLLLPVTGNASLVLYRNIYCAACAGERHPVFWLAKLRCSRNQLIGGGSSGRGLDLRAIMRASCPVDFAPVREWGGRPGGPRRCTAHIGRCDRDWADDGVRAKCRSSATDYVFAGNRAFRNKYCALCNYVNETYLRCDDVRPQTKADVTSGGYFEETAASVVTLDFNRGRAVVMETVPGSDYVTERRVDFPACSPEGGRVYDPFADVCRNVTCLPEVGFSAGNCFRQPETAEQNDRAAEESSVTSNDEGQAEEQDKDYDVKIFDSTAVAVVTAAGVAVTTVATDFVPMSARFVLFRMNRLQRLLALLGTLLCVLCLCVFVVLYVIYESMRTDPANRYVVCLSLCLLVAHLLFPFVVLPAERLFGPLPCFCLSIVIQYAYITAFFWLNVLSVDVFRRLTADRPNDPTTAANRCACFALFSLLAWVVPAVPMAASTAIAVLRVDGWEQLYGGGTAEEEEEDGCFVLGMSQLLLFLVPVAIVVTTNFAMYVIVTCRICAEPRPIGADKDRFRQTLKDRKLFVTCVQLTVVMTTTWALALVAHLTGLTFVWYLFIVFDTMQGLSVAAAFAFKVKVWRQFNGGSRSVTITKASSSAETKKSRNRGSSSSDGVDTAIEPFVDTLPEGVESPVVPSNAPQDAIFRETSI